MQPRFSYAPMLSAGLELPVSLTWWVHDYGPYRTMLLYPQSEEFKRNLPKANVWNFHEIDMELPINNAGAWPYGVMAAREFLNALRMVEKKED